MLIPYVQSVSKAILSLHFYYPETTGITT